MTPVSYRDDFSIPDGHIWLNCAHQGPIPDAAAQAAREAVAWKQAPFTLTTERFSGVPARLRAAIARLIRAGEDEVVLGNSASFGMHLLANGFPLHAGDEVLLTEGDFPSILLPWMARERDGIRAVAVRPAAHLLTPEELEAALTPRTRVFCTSWVHSFSGVAADLEGLGQVCRRHGVTFIVNASQATGARVLDTTALPVDAVTNVGFKWLLGPYGTGFCWIRPALRALLRPTKTYWLSYLTADDLMRPDLDIRPPEGPPDARRFDVFGTANFFNFLPWTASIAYLLEQGPEAIAAHDDALVTRLVDGLDRRRYTLVSPERGPRRSTLVFVTHREPERNAAIYRALKDRNIHIALRRGALRLSPHCYNTPAEIDGALEALHAATAG